MPIIVPQVRTAVPHIGSRGSIDFTGKSRRADEEHDAKMRMAALGEAAMQHGRDQERADVKALAESAAFGLGKQRTPFRQGGDLPAGEEGFREESQPSEAETSNRIRRDLEEQGADPRDLDALNNLVSLAKQGVSADVIRELKGDIEKRVRGGISDKFIYDFGVDLTQTMERSENPDIPFSTRTAALSEQILEQINNPGFGELDPQEQMRLIAGFQATLAEAKFADREDQNDLDMKLKVTNEFSAGVDEWKATPQYKSMMGQGKYDGEKAFNALLLDFKQGGKTTASQIQYAFRFMTDDGFRGVATENDRIKEELARSIQREDLARKEYENATRGSLTPTQRVEAREVAEERVDEELGERPTNYWGGKSKEEIDKPYDAERKRLLEKYTKEELDFRRGPQGKPSSNGAAKGGDEQAEMDRLIGQGLSDEQIDKALGGG